MSSPPSPIRRWSSRPSFTLLELVIVMAVLVAIISIAWPRLTGRLQVALCKEAALQLKRDCAEAREHAMRYGEPWIVRYRPGESYYQVGSLVDLQDSADGPEGSSIDVGIDELQTTDEKRNSARSKERDDPTSRPSSRETTVLAEEGVEGASSTIDVGQGTHARSNPNVVGNVTPPPPETLQLPPGVVFIGNSTVEPTYDDRSLQAHTLPTDQAESQASEDSRSLPDPSRASVDPSDFEASPQNRFTTWQTAVVYQPDGRTTDMSIQLAAPELGTQVALRVRGLTGASTIDPVTYSDETLRPNRGSGDDQPVWYADEPTTHGRSGRNMSSESRGTSQGTASGTSSGAGGN